MDAKIDPKVVMDLSIFKIGGWNSLQPRKQNLLEEFIDKNEPRLSNRIPSRDPFMITQYLERHTESSEQHTKKLVPLRQSLHVMMQCYMRQHFADRYWLHEHPWEHASRREPTTQLLTLWKDLCADGMFRRYNQNRVNIFRKTTGFFADSWRIKIALESCFEEHAQEVWERNCMSPEMQTTLFNTYPPKLIATILKALREQLKRSDQLHSVEEIAGPVPEILLEYDQILKRGRKFSDDVNRGYLPRDLVLAALREEVDWVHSEGVYEIGPMQERRDAGMKPLDLIWVDTNKFVDPTREKIRSRLRVREYNTKKESKIQRALPASWLFSAMPPLEAAKGLVSIMMSVSLSHKGKPLKLRHYDISRAHFQRTAQRLFYIRLPAEDRQKCGEDKVGRLVKSMYGTQDASHIWQLDCVDLICGELGAFWRGTHNAALFHNPNQDVRMAVNGDDFVCLSDDDGLKHIDSLLKSKYRAKDMGTLGFEDSDVKNLLWLNRYSEWDLTNLDSWHSEPDLRPTYHQWIGTQYEHESGEHATRETTRQTGVRRKTKSVSEERWSSTIQICLHETFMSGPRQWILLKQRNIWPREWAGLVNSILSRWNVLHGVWWESRKQRWDFEDRNKWTKSQSSWTATLLATQSRERARRDW